MRMCNIYKIRMDRSANPFTDESTGDNESDVDRITAHKDFV